ncbi:MAG: Gfo/Idh/MocA family oxidoreductase [Proteobacteria bacterium]|nr:Gfo/Idh/MocA family oxidoreductase [Pseudomonadota bacterium]MBI3498812.1 Gfo/Idh/MocA family oxidoreductase [Pseudomonadota bacterium]
MSLRAMVLGAGSAGEGHAIALQQAGVKVVAMASRTQAVVEAVAKRLNIPEASTDWRASLRHVRPDIIAVATPGDSHVEMVEAALAANCHVYVDKPLAPTALAAKGLWQRVEAGGRKSAYAATSHYQPSAQLARSLIAEGAIGQPLEAEFVSHYRWSSLLPHGWPHRLVTGGGRLNNNFTHKLAIAEHVLRGITLEVAGETRNDLKRAPIAPPQHDFRDWHNSAVAPEAAAKGQWGKVDSDWSYTVLARIGRKDSPAADGVSVAFRHSCLRKAKLADYVAFYGSEGTIHVDQAYCQGDVHLWREGESGFRVVPVPPEILGNLPPVEMLSHWPPGWEVPQRAWNALARDFVADVEGRPHDDYFTIEDGWRFQEIIDAIRARSGWSTVPARL